MLRIVETKYGSVRGIPAADPRITSFKGIPFAAPPVGENRWRAPQPLKPWEGVLDASRFAPISMQSIPGLGTDIYCREWHVDPDIPMDEDCLYLNIWTGAKSADEKLPVLVWFFGGALQWGYPPEMEFDGERIARRGVIVVSVNYRLNAFGFLAHPELTASQPESPANFGSLDQQAGLKWVAENIAAFGGDPENITIAGQSAGGGSVLTQMTCPDNYGIIKKAVIMSAMIRNPYNGWGIGIPATMEQGEKQGEEFFEFLGVKTLAEARALDAKYIRDKFDEFYNKTHKLFTNVIDNVICIGDPMMRVANNQYANIPIMAGCTADEFPSVIEASSREEFEAKAKEIFGDKAETFLAFEEANRVSAAGYASTNGIEASAKCIFLKDEANGNGGKNYFYRFEPDIPGWDNPGTFHSVDLWFFFETLAKCWRPFVGRHYDLARQMCNYFTNFIKTGDPNGDDITGEPMPKWESYGDKNRSEMLFTANGPVSRQNEESDYIKFMMEHVSTFF